MLSNYRLLFEHVVGWEARVLNNLWHCCRKYEKGKSPREMKLYSSRFLNYVSRRKEYWVRGCIRAPKDRIFAVGANYYNSQNFWTTYDNWSKYQMKQHFGGLNTVLPARVQTRIWVWVSSKLHVARFSFGKISNSNIRIRLGHLYCVLASALFV